MVVFGGSKQSLSLVLVLFAVSVYCDTYVFWANWNPPSIYRTTIESGDVVLVRKWTNHTFGPLGIFVANDRLFYTITSDALNKSNNGTIWSIDMTTFQDERIEQDVYHSPGGTGEPSWIYVDAEHMYWLDGVTYSSSSLFKKRLGSSHEPELLVNSSLHYDDSTVIGDPWNNHWLFVGNKTSILHVRKDGERRNILVESGSDNWGYGPQPDPSTNLLYYQTGPQGGTAALYSANKDGSNITQLLQNVAMGGMCLEATSGTLFIAGDLSSYNINTHQEIKNLPGPPWGYAYNCVSVLSTKK